MVYLKAKLLKPLSERDAQGLVEIAIRRQENTIFMPCPFESGANFSQLKEFLAPGSFRFVIIENSQARAERYLRGFCLGYFGIRRNNIKFIPVNFEVKENPEEKGFFYESIIPRNQELYSIFIHIFGEVEISRFRLVNEGVRVITVRHRRFLPIENNLVAKTLAAEQLSLPPTIIEDLANYILLLRQWLAAKQKGGGIKTPETSPDVKKPQLYLISN